MPDDHGAGNAGADATMKESDRIELDPDLAPSTISSEVLHEICRHALDVAPEECCGLVLGNPETTFLRSVRISNVMTKKHLEDPMAFPRDAFHAYYMSEIEYQRIIEEAEASSEHVCAIYHSHVEQGCYLSKDDLAFAVHPLFPFPEASQIVVSILAERIDEVGIFERAEDGPSQFIGRRLEAISEARST
jgi:[CysO sulfur-carrier protein]-S-L-cysteine hydrolase